MGIHYYIGAAGLAEYLFKLYNGKGSAVDNILQNIACTDGRKLVAVAYQNQLAGNANSTQHSLKQQRIYHRHFVDYQSITVKKVIFVVFETQGIT